MIDTVIFDAEGVVIDTEHAWDAAQAAMLRKRGHDYDRDRVKPLLTGRSLEEGAAVLKHQYSLADDLSLLTAERLELVMQHLAQESSTFICGFESFFKQVGSTHKMAIATSMDPRLFDIVDRRLGLSDRFKNHVVTVRDVGDRGKPQPDVFLCAARKVSSRANTCVVIEDAPLGIEAARRAGMRTIGLTTTYRRELLSEADLVVDDYAHINLDVLGRA